MVFCSNCGSSLPAGSRFCSSCGTPVQAPSTEENPPSTPPRDTPAPAPVARAPAPVARTSPTHTSTSKTPKGETMTACGPCKAEDVICPVCKKQCGTLLDKVVGTQHYHLDCFICNECKKYLGGSQFFRDPRQEGMLLCAGCKDSVYGSSGHHARVTHTGVAADGETGSTGYTVHRPVINAYGVNKCRRCGKTVYENEKLRCCEAVWHRKCFTCEKCGVKLDLSRYETLHNNPYCRDCFATIPH